MTGLLHNLCTRSDAQDAVAHLGVPSLTQLLSSPNSKVAGHSACILAGIACDDELLHNLTDAGAVGITLLSAFPEKLMWLMAAAGAQWKFALLTCPKTWSPLPSCWWLVGVMNC